MNSQTTQPRRLYRSTTDRQLTGLCGGIAVYFGIDSSMVRLLWIIVTILTGVMPGILAYIVAAMVVPQEPHRAGTTS